MEAQGWEKNPFLSSLHRCLLSVIEGIKLLWLIFLELLVMVRWYAGKARYEASGNVTEPKKQQNLQMFRCCYNFWIASVVREVISRLLCRIICPSWWIVSARKTLLQFECDPARYSRVRYCWRWSLCFSGDFERITCHQDRRKRIVIFRLP